MSTVVIKKAWIRTNLFSTEDEGEASKQEASDGSPGRATSFNFLLNKNHEQIFTLVFFQMQKPNTSRILTKQKRRLGKKRGAGGGASFNAKSFN